MVFCFKYMGIYIKHIIFIVALFPCLMLSQNKPSIFTFKPSLGLNGCQIHGDNAAGYNKLGMHGGILVNSYFTEKLSLDLGIVFTQKGARKNQDPENGDFSYFRVNLNYIEIPILLNYKLNKHYFLTFGPSLAYLINYTEDTEVGNWNGVYPFNDFEYGVNIGLGRDFYKHFLIEIRSGNSYLPVRNYGIAANQVFFPNAIARFFNKGLYNNILSAIVIYQIKPNKKSEPIKE